MIISKIKFIDSYELQPGAKRPMHVHALSQAEVLLEGTFILLTEEGEHVLKPGAWVALGPGVPHGWRADTSLRAITFKFHVEGLRMPDRPCLSPGATRDGWMRELPSRILLAWKSGVPDLQEAAGHLMSVMLKSIFLKRAPVLDLKWQELLDELERVQTPGLSLQEMARRVNLSTPHFRRCFKARFGQAPGQYQLEKKLVWARDVLRFTSRPIKEVADRAGYADLSAFGKAFFGRFHVRPRLFRKKAGKA